MELRGFLRYVSVRIIQQVNNKISHLLIFVGMNVGDTAETSRHTGPLVHGN